MRLSDEVLEQLANAVQNLDVDALNSANVDWSRLLVTTACAAAGNRNRQLSRAVAQQLHRRRGLPFGVRLYAALTACAWTENIEDWCVAIRERLARLTIDLGREDARHLLFALDTLCEAQPLLLPRIASQLARVRATALQLGA